MAGSMNYVDPRRIARAFSGVASSEDAGARYENQLLTGELLRERIAKARREAAAAADEAAQYAPEAIDQRVMLEAGNPIEGQGALREVRAAAEGAPPIEGPPINPEVAERLRQALLVQGDPSMQRSNAAQVQQARATGNRSARSADLVRQAVQGTLPRDRLNQAVEANQGNAYTPYRVQDHQVIDQGTGTLGRVTDVGQSVAGLNLARGQTEGERQNTERARQGELGTRSGYNTARTNRVNASPPIGTGGGRGGAGGGGEDSVRKLRAAADLAAKRQGLTGVAYEEFVSDYMENGGRMPQKQRPLTGASANDTVRSEFGSDPNMKGKRLGSYDRARGGYAIYDGKKLIGYWKVD